MLFISSRNIICGVSDGYSAVVDFLSDAVGIISGRGDHLRWPPEETGTTYIHAYSSHDTTHSTSQHTGYSYRLHLFCCLAVFSILPPLPLPPASILLGGVCGGRRADHQLDDVIETNIIVKQRVAVFQLEGREGRGVCVEGRERRRGLTGR